MFRKETVLRKLQKILSGKGNKLFDNQVSFYNAIFGMTNPEIFPEELVAYMETAAHDGPRERRKQDVDSFFKGGLDNSSSNIGKHINDDPGMGIPKFHCVHYAQTEYKREICKRLSTVIRYIANRRKTNLEELFLCLKEELSWASGILSQTETADGMLLATILYEIVQTHLGERRRPEESGEETSFGKVNMKRQIEEYYLTCDCYEVTSIDFFFALRRMAGQNVIASSNLAGFYYVGMEFVVKNEAGGPHGKYVVERNLEQAAHYFKRAASSQPPYAPALYSYGYMLLHGEIGDLSAEQRMEESERYYRLAAAQKFHHAVSGLGDLALLRAERLLKQPGVEARSDEIVTELAAAIGYFDQAERMGSFWGPIKAAQFLDASLYEPYREQALVKASLTGKQTARARWKQAVAMGNVFAMDELAMLDLRLGYIEEAQEMLEQASRMNYPNASYHLARYFYRADGLRPDEKKYIHCMEKAAHDGSARASLALGKLALAACDAAETTEEKVRQQKLASAWLQKAEEQNFSCFEKDVYEQLRQYK
ncbi:MAG: tetratricopeptide repeat protein [Acutalibacteraceae bacterium]|jgi:TPR repeat protein